MSEDFDAPDAPDADAHPEIRSLLGSLDDEVMPPEVRARLRAVITDQASQRSASSPAHNLRRIAVAWVGAAAAVVVLVAGVSAITRGDEQGDSAVTSQDAGAAEEAPGPATADRESTSDSILALPVVRPDHLAADAARVRERVPQARVTAPTAPPGCAPGQEARPGTQVFTVSYRGAPAVLVIAAGPPATATVWSCDDRRLQTVPLPD